MMRPALVPAAVMAVILLTGCTSSPPADIPGDEPAPLRTEATVGAPSSHAQVNSIAGISPEPSSVDGNVFAVGNVQAQQIHVLMGFVSDYNRGDVDSVMARLAPDARWSDCDYGIGEEVRFDELDSIRAWLTSRRDLNDTMSIESVANSSDGQVGILSVSVAARENDVLGGLGFSDGVRPDLGVKIEFTDELMVSGFIAGGPPPACDPAAGQVGVSVG